MAAMLEVLYASGMRVSELIHLPVNALQQTDAYYFMMVKGKGNKERMVPLHASAVAALNAYNVQKQGKSRWLFPFIARKG